MLHFTHLRERMKPGLALAIPRARVVNAARMRMDQKEILRGKKLPAM